MHRLKLYWFERSFTFYTAVAHRQLCDTHGCLRLTYLNTSLCWSMSYSVRLNHKSKGSASSRVRRATQHVAIDLWNLNDNLWHYNERKTKTFCMQKICKSIYRGLIIRVPDVSTPRSKYNLIDILTWHVRQPTFALLDDVVCFTIQLTCRFSVYGIVVAISIWRLQLNDLNND